jgi:hypothetical protein
MDDVKVIDEAEQQRATGERVSESVRHALRLVGPAEAGAQRLWSEAAPVSPPEEAT